MSKTETYNNTLLDRIDKNAKQITMYRKKLEENVVNIARLFSPHDDCCNVCGYTENSHRDGDPRGEDGHSFGPVINIEIDYKSKKPFINNLDETFYLKIEGGMLVAAFHDDDNEEDSVLLENLDLEVIHHMIKTDAIPAFFEELVDVLDKTTKQYRAVLEMSEKLVAATR